MLSGGVAPGYFLKPFQGYGGLWLRMRQLNLLFSSRPPPGRGLRHVGVKFSGQVGVLELNGAVVDAKISGKHMPDIF